MPYVKPSADPKPSRRPYPSDLSDAEWEVIEPLLPTSKERGQQRIHPRREILNAIRYVLRGGIAWRAVPHDLPPWATVWSYFRQWRDDDTWKQIHDALHRQVRQAAGREPAPSAAILDSQSVKTTEKGGPAAMTRASRSRAASGFSSLIPRAG
jgi:transposase